MTVGEVLRQLRIDKNLTQREVAAGIMSRSHLSELEHGDYYPAYDTMLRLLRRLNITLTEFQTEIGAISDEPGRAYIQHTNHLSTEQKLPELERYLTEVFTDDVAKSDLRLRMKRLNMLGLVNFELHPQTVNLNDYQPIFDYLLGCQNWHEYEIRLLANSIFLAQYDVAKMLAHQFVTKGRRVHFHDFKIKVALFFHNLMEIALDHGDDRLSKQYATQSLFYGKAAHSLSFQIDAEIFLELIAIRAGTDIGQNKQKIEHRISMFEELGYQDVANSRRQAVKKYLA
ncbi:helix-turn-helix domain-containing protein [Furfurilactobacillus rossiae]|uniref:Transcription regulator n=1 Tax=Furfurilactobacillus rossiae DSM 15814 TaxID=1114972 RepID=A0A0R1RET0_9LACO|nr:helix-turn-helix transcriptional regulator [Furfurilactobacillus rossiae]KRL53780.1 transcription regulator [Furfurilactobacillus rossiae DSM 15814]QFR66721.1 helix-turn-helix domain-containing protein [Furfurilactobacillus rossiae]QLE62198.1 hypothetical protein LROSRS0_2153 [Furfurilactobacillus rossiae]